jgi:hypothetical protein
MSAPAASGKVGSNQQGTQMYRGTVKQVIELIILCLFDV